MECQHIATQRARKTINGVPYIVQECVACKGIRSAVVDEFEHEKQKYYRQHTPATEIRLEEPICH